MKQKRQRTEIVRLIGVTATVLKRDAMLALAGDDTCILSAWLLLRQVERTLRTYLEATGALTRLPDGRLAPSVPDDDESP